MLFAASFELSSPVIEWLIAVKRPFPSFLALGRAVHWRSSLFSRDIDRHKLPTTSTSSYKVRDEVKQRVMDLISTDGLQLPFPH